MVVFFLGIISGIIVVVVSQIFVKLFINPVHDLNEELGRLNHTLIFRYNVFANPGTTNKSISTETSNELRTHASLLLAKANRVHWYTYFTIFKLIPPKDNIYEAHKLLLGIAHSDTCEDKKDNREDCKRIADLLNLIVRI